MSTQSPQSSTVSPNQEVTVGSIGTGPANNIQFWVPPTVADRTGHRRHRLRHLQTIDCGDVGLGLDQAGPASPTSAQQQGQPGDVPSWVPPQLSPNARKSS